MKLVGASGIDASEDVFQIGQWFDAVSFCRRDNGHTNSRRFFNPSALWGVFKALEMFSPTVSIAANLNAITICKDGVKPWRSITLNKSLEFAHVYRQCRSLWIKTLF